MKVGARACRKAAFYLGSSIACLSAPAAYAQESGATQAQDSSRDIIVTATRRSEREVLQGFVRAWPRACQAPRALAIPGIWVVTGGAGCDNR